MKQFTRLVWFAIAALALSACEQVYSGKLILDGSHRFAAGEVVDGELVLLGGKAVLEAGSQVTGSIYMLSGTIAVDGDVAGDITFIAGNLELGPNARVGGDINAGGDINRSPEASIAGKVNTGSGLQMPEVSTLSPRSLAVDLFQAIFMAALAFLVLNFAPQPTARVAQAIQDHPVIMAAMGLLSGVVGLVLLVFMAFTIILIPVTLIGLLILLAAVAYGWIAFGLITWRILKRWLKLEFRLPVAASLGTLVFVIFIYTIRFVPLVGDWIGLLAIATGLGAVLLTRFGLQTFVPAADMEIEGTYS